MPIHLASSRAARVASATTAMLLLLTLAACQGGAAVAPTVSESLRTTPKPTAEATSATDAVDDGGFADAFAERDQFQIDQQQPLDGSALVARTPEQQEFIAEQRAYTESQGGSWSAEAETISLALALDVCETSILNQHVVDADVFAAHVASSPLIAAVAGDDPVAIKGAVEIMVFGAGFLCPADYQQWLDAKNAVPLG